MAEAKKNGTPTTKAGPVKLDVYAFACGCGYGQRGDTESLGLTKGTKEHTAALVAGRQWDGQTFVYAPAGQGPVCPHCKDAHEPDSTTPPAGPPPDAGHVLSAAA